MPTPEDMRAGHRKKLALLATRMRDSRDAYERDRRARNEAMAAAHGPKKLGGLSYAEIADITADKGSAKTGKSRVIQIIRDVRVKR